MNNDVIGPGARAPDAFSLRPLLLSFVGTANPGDLGQLCPLHAQRLDTEWTRRASRIVEHVLGQFICRRMKSLLMVGCLYRTCNIGRNSESSLRMHFNVQISLFSTP